MDKQPMMMADAEMDVKVKGTWNRTDFTGTISRVVATNNYRSVTVCITLDTPIVRFGKVRKVLSVMYFDGVREDSVYSFNATIL